MSNLHTAMLEAEAITTKERGQWSMVMTRFFRHRAAVISLVIFVLIVLFAYIGPFLWKWDYKIHSEIPSWVGPSLDHPFGTDKAGRDMLGAMMQATKQSMNVALVVAVGSTVIGALVGACAGFYRGWVDSVLMRIVDVLFVIPFLVITAAIAGAIDGGAQWYHMAFILAVFGWLSTARAVRAEVLSLREKEFIEAAKAAGGSDWHIITKHLIPNTMSVIIVSATLQIAFAILSETTLSFLGLGIQSPDTSLGLLIEAAGASAFNEHWYLFYIPGLMIILIALTINFIGDGLRDALDPRQTMVRR
ncbi:ABC transporter permease [Glycomyces buryatensis]|uniref:ABC transporter permease n=1 Tax=Glycomyces buryatensis TaxID=2570927 RepID=A0A4S8QNI1_9ACTN|nr:ABC transporter permease [Glycomyces buryatensis]THV42274.1 ABC transporter permease [Glycomyces buryatensis]